MTPDQERIKLGIIGCGWVTQAWHLPALTALKEVDIVAVADCDAARMKLAADRFHIPHRYGHASALLNHPALDAVAVCVPPQHHVEIALAALDAGKHVLIEKPLALTLTDCDTLAERARQTSTTVMVGFNLRWHRLIRQARAALHDGALGPLSMIRTAFTNGVYHNSSIPRWRRQRALGGGVLHDMAVHHFDLWRFLLQSEVKEISVTSQAGQGDDETAVVTGRMDNDVLLSAAFSAGTSDTHELEFYGQNGRLRLSCYRYDGWEWQRLAGTSGGIGTRLRALASKMRTAPYALAALRNGGEMLASYRGQWRHFIECVRRRTPAECTIEDGRRAVQTAQAAFESASCGRPITLNR
ncbi:MAG: Gfo/Idh/MocA family protein [Nitrospiraceae bacterium]